LNHSGSIGFIGIDLATEDARATIVYGLDNEAQKTHIESAPLARVVKPRPSQSEQEPASWVVSVASVLKAVTRFARENKIEIRGICVTATSGTVVAINERGKFLSPAVMYDDARASDPITRLGMSLQSSEKPPETVFLRHASDVINGWLTDDLGAPSDWSHALKTGFDPAAKAWSGKALMRADEYLLKVPTVAPPGSQIGAIGKIAAEATGLNLNIPVYLGMTDGCTSHIAAGVMALKSATTTIGTTLVTKVVCDSNISGQGFYSHLLPLDSWLCGGASNLGGSAFKNFVTDLSLSELDARAHKFGPASFVTYPLTGQSERFPFTRNEISAFATGSSDNLIENYRSVLEGLAFAEKLSYEILSQAGAASRGPIYTGGGGSKSAHWCQIRSDVLGLPVFATSNATSGMGAALIAWAASQTPDISKPLSRRPITGQTFEPDHRVNEQLESSYQNFLAELRSREWLG
jgi:sugar (pentulose or hexulose) kinase